MDFVLHGSRDGFIRTCESLIGCSSSATALRRRRSSCSAVPVGLTHSSIGTREIVVLAEIAQISLPGYAAG